LPEQSFFCITLPTLSMFQYIFPELASVSGINL
jgi:hypothetical protein